MADVFRVLDDAEAWLVEQATKEKRVFTAAWLRDNFAKLRARIEAQGCQ